MTLGLTFFILLLLCIIVPEVLMFVLLILLVVFEFILRLFGRSFDDDPNDKTKIK